MKTRIGALLSIVLGAVLIITGTTSGGASSVGVSVVECGGSVPIGGVSPECPTGHVVIHKVVNGPVSDAPSGGWVFTISSGCSIFPGTSDTVTIGAAGGTASSGPLFSTTSVGGTQCVYTIIETAAPGWTTTYSPTTGKVSLGTATSGGPTVNDAAIMITNTHPEPSTSVVTSSTAPTTPSASASPTTTLANTGSKSVKPATFVGIALVAGGVILLFAGRRRRSAQH